MKIPKPKGTLIPMGGGADNEEILRRIIKETGIAKPKICYFTLATDSPKEAMQKHKKTLKGVGIKDVSFIHYELHSEADLPENIEKVKNCHAVLFGGGNQLKLSILLGGTSLMAEIKKKYYDESHFVISGNSAGAVAMPNTMIISGSSQDALIKGELELANGLDLIDNMIIDTHFAERGRFGRLIQNVTYNPGVLGLGLGEETAVVIKKGEKLEVIGSGTVVIVDGSSIDYTNLTEILDGDPITVAGIKIHLLGRGKQFLIDEKKCGQPECNKITI